MKRVMIIGGPGSGKSTLARALGKSTGLPIYHMDLLHWKPGWVERDRDEKIAQALEIIGKDEWIFEGGMSATYSQRIARADTLIWLDFPVGQRLFRVLKRRVQYKGGQTRPDLPENCPERLDREFLQWIVMTARKNRARDARLATQASHVQLHHLRTTQQVNQFIAALPGLPVRTASR